MEMTGKVAAVTGAAMGMGREIAVGLAREGCHLALCDIDVPGLRKTCELCEAEGVPVSIHQIDMVGLW